MKKITSFVTTIILAIGVSTAVSSCKKGEGDPFLSLQSRKARVAGEWKLSKMESVETIGTGNSATTITGTYDGTTLTQVATSNNVSVTTTDKYTVEMTFEKDGSFKSVYTDNNGNTPQVTTSTGVWNFTSGVGEYKNKSQLVTYTESMQSGNSTTTFVGSERPTAVYDIYQLKSKEMIFKRKGSDMNSTIDETSTFTAK